MVAAGLADRAGGAVVSPRWVGSGWTIFEQQGQAGPHATSRFSPRPTHSSSPRQTGVSTVTLYDPAGRVVAVLHPDNTWEKTVFDAWRQESWDGNDTVLIADPRTDADVGDLLSARTRARRAFTSWYALRIGGNFGASRGRSGGAEGRGDRKPLPMRARRSTAHFDRWAGSAWRSSTTAAAVAMPTRTALDTEGKPLAVFDALGRRAQEIAARDHAGAGCRMSRATTWRGSPLYHINADAGARRSLNNVAGKPIRAGTRAATPSACVYDAAQRPTRRYVSVNGAAEILIELTIYGEGQPAANLCGRVFRHYDMAGYVENSQYDFKGNLLTSARQIAVEYQAGDRTGRNRSPH